MIRRVHSLDTEAGVSLTMAEMTEMIQNAAQGNLSVQELLPVVYRELRSLAAVRLARERDCQTLQPTALVHEAYLRLFDTNVLTGWENRAHFFGAAAEAMRRILIDRARRKLSLKAGGEFKRIPMVELSAQETLPPEELLELHEALGRLEQLFPRKAEVVKLRFFAGLTHPQIAELLRVSLATVENDWAYARCWLKLELNSQTINV